MIPAQYYKPIYLFIITILSIYSFLNIQNLMETNFNKCKQEKQYSSIFLTVFMILFIGMRPISGRYFMDMGGTANMWNWWSQGDVYSFQWHYGNKIYDNLRAFMSTYGMRVELFFFIISTIYFSCIYISCKKLFPQYTFFAMLVYLIAFSTFSYATNGIKAGAAAALFLIVLAFYDNYKIFIPFILLSWGFHHSMVMVVVSFICVFIWRKSKFYFILWVITLILSALHFTYFQKLFASLDDAGEAYLIGQLHGKGFRWDFIAYSVIPVIIGYYKIYIEKIELEQYTILLNFYLLTNSIWMLCMYAEFTNRIAYLSWFIHPWVMIYPFLNEKISALQIRNVKYLAIGHLIFNLFLLLIYW